MSIHTLASPLTREDMPAEPVPWNIQISGNYIRPSHFNLT